MSFCEDSSTFLSAPSSSFALKEKLSVVEWWKISFGCVCCYLTQLCYPGNGSLPGVLSIHGVLFEKQEYLVVLRVVTLRDQVDAYEPGV